MRQMALALLQAGVYAGPMPPAEGDEASSRDWLVVLEHLRARSVHYGSEAQCRWIATNPNRLGRVVEGPRRRDAGSRSAAGGSA
jgi:hypothetical protein